MVLFAKNKNKETQNSTKNKQTVEDVDDPSAQRYRSD